MRKFVDISEYNQSCDCSNNKNIINDRQKKYCILDCLNDYLEQEYYNKNINIDDANRILNCYRCDNELGSPGYSCDDIDCSDISFSL